MTTLISSPGAYGFYPWLDQDRGYWAVLSTRINWLDGDRPLVRSSWLVEAVRPAIHQALGQ